MDETADQCGFLGIYLLVLSAEGLGLLVRFYKHISGNNHQNSRCVWFDWDSWRSVFSAVCLFKGHAFNGAEEAHPVVLNLSSAAWWGSVGVILENPESTQVHEKQSDKSILALQASEDRRRYHHWWTDAFSELFMKGPSTFVYVHTHTESFPTGFPYRFTSQTSDTSGRSLLKQVITFLRLFHFWYLAIYY